MRLLLPVAAFPYSSSSEQDMREVLTRAMVPVVSTEEAVPHLYLQAPDGGVWKVTVSDTGTLTTVKVQG